jgi:cobalt/nickel transport system ATP-binding protein
MNLVVETGDRVAILGLNGSGKTTLLLSAVGLVPFEGSLRVFNETLDSGNLAAVRRRTGLLFNVPEDQLLMPRVRDDVAYGPGRRGVPPRVARESSIDMLSRLGIEADAAEGSIHALSHGQKLRVALAGALVTSPELLLLDEPSAGIDPPGRRDLASLLDNVTATILVATHDLEFAGRVCRRFVLLEQGRLAWEGTSLDAVRQRWALDS